MLKKLQTLLDILIERLPHLKRWENVGIYFPGDTFPKDTIGEEEAIPGYFYILFFRPRRQNSPNPYEYKEVPLTKEDLDAIIKRQREKLKSESQNI